jgi:hypothetical protein
MDNKEQQEYPLRKNGAALELKFVNIHTFSVG